MIWQIFSLYPQIFESFLSTSLIARAIDKKILEFQIINWRNFGTGNYKQVDDRPFGGGSGMVLQVEPIIKALIAHNSLSDFGKIRLSKLEKDLEKTKEIEQKCRNDKEISQQISKFEEEIGEKIRNIQVENKFESENNYQILPSNSQFYNWFEENKNLEKLQENFQMKERSEQKSFNNQSNQFTNEDLKNKKATILLTPRGFPLNQKICQWLSEFDQISLICGRFEGFDYRLNQVVDLEISIGDFVCNGGEIPAMCLVEAVSRLVPDFITKSTSHLHDSFSDQNNEYSEQKEFAIGKKKLQEFETDFENLQKIKNQLQSLK